MTKSNTLTNEVTLSAPNFVVRLWSSAAVSGPASVPTSLVVWNLDGPPPAAISESVSGRLGAPPYTGAAEKRAWSMPPMESAAPAGTVAALRLRATAASAATWNRNIEFSPSVGRTAATAHPATRRPDPLAGLPTRLLTEQAGTSG